MNTFFDTLIIAPVAIFLLAAAVILILRLLRPGFGFTWLIAVSSTLVAWGVVLFLRLRLPLSMVLIPWKPESIFPFSPALSLDQVSWPYAFALISLALGVLLTATARYQYQTNAFAWAGSMLLTAVGLLAVLAANPLSLILTWTAIDLVELLILLVNSQEIRLRGQVVVAFAARLMGTLVVMAALIAGQANGQVVQLSTAPEGVGLILLIGVGLRLGVFPLHLPFRKEPPMRRGLGTVLRLVPVTASLVVLARLPAGIVPAAWAPWLLAFTALGAFYGALLWIRSEDEISGRPYWVIAFSSLAITCVVRGEPLGSLAWGIALILAGGNLFLFSARSRRLLFIPVLGLWGLGALPYSPAASGLHGLVSGPFAGFNIFYLGALALLLVGYARHALKPGDSLESMERWIYLIYPLGLVFLTGTQVVLGVFGWKGSVSAGVPWASTAVSIFALASGLLMVRLTAWPDMESTWWQPFLGSILDFGAAVLRLDWVYRLFRLAYRAIGRLVAGLIAILEGDGGVIWALVLLALLATFLRSEGVP
ncbi:MAG TPA: hypothetical protein VMT46_03775 [Anaerolineaceae bacterium]|nr:hypothetical protein [Anaerolineaceae bacterium]